MRKFSKILIHYSGRMSDNFPGTQNTRLPDLEILIFFDSTCIGILQKMFQRYYFDYIITVDKQLTNEEKKNLPRIIAIQFV